MIKCRKQGNLTQLESFLWRIHRNTHQSLQEFPWSFRAAGFKDNMGKSQGFLLASKRFYYFLRHYPDTTTHMLSIKHGYGCWG